MLASYISHKIQCTPVMYAVLVTHLYFHANHNRVYSEPVVSPYKMHCLVRLVGRGVRHKDKCW